MKIPPSNFDAWRRRSLSLLGGGAALAWMRGSLAQQSTPACTVTPTQTEGPYFLDAGLQRSDIRGEPGSGAALPGVPLALGLRLLAVRGDRCTPLAGAVVDIWHCDAAGRYSGVEGNPGRFLRGYQTSDAQGRVQFMSIYPGWYPGRAVHVHFKLRSRSFESNQEFTSQLYFDEALNDKVLAQAPYRRSGSRTRNEADFSYRDGGSRLLLKLQPQGVGYVGSFDIGVRMT